MSQSSDWAERLGRVIPWGSSTCSKKARFLPDEPGVIVRGRGCRVWDADGREYIDFRNGLGPVTLGYCFGPVDEAIRRQLEDGVVFGHPHPLEGQVAEMLRDSIPCAERVRFLKTGGEAVAACIRLARCHTGRDHTVQIGYSGWLNALASGGRSLPGSAGQHVPPGVPMALAALHHACDWNDTEALRGLFEREGDRIAAVVVAADYVGMGEGESFYPFLRELTQRHGALLIFDEIVTGFRIAVAGVQEYFGVTPDLAAFAKGMANGMPLSAYCGSAAVMDRLDKAIVSSTYGGEALSLAAAKATIESYRSKDVIGHLWKTGEVFCAGLREVFLRHGLAADVRGLCPCAALTFPTTAPAGVAERFFRSAYRHGVSLYGVNYLTFSHQEADIHEALARLDAAVAKL